MPLLLDLSHTSHTRARSGIQRVARGLWRNLGADALALTFDPYGRGWRSLRPWELRRLAATKPVANRGAHWPLAAKMRGWLAGTGKDSAWAAGATGLIVPELFGAQVGRALPSLLERVPGPRVAVFHDALGLRLPEFSPPKVVARLPSYLRALAAFDGIAAVSASAREELLGYWAWLGLRNPPPVIAIPLGVDPPAPFPAPLGMNSPNTSPNRRQILCVSTLEARKNHLALLEACEGLWSQGAQFSLRLIGAKHATGQAAIARISALQRAGRPLIHEGPVDEDILEEAYAAAAFTVYPSLAEGFGLPVAESLVRGKPCVCSGAGAVGEIAAGGGCLTIDPPDAPHLREAIGRLLQNPAELSALAQVASRRRFATTADHARRLLEWMQTLPLKGK